MPTFLLFCVIVIFSSSSLAHPLHFNNLTDRRSLLEFKAALTNDPSRALANWNPNISFCGWRGVTCSSRRQRVVAINLPGMHLEGAISPFLANLSFLRWLDLSENHLHGVIPPQLGRLFRLRALSLSLNALEGAIPNSIPFGCRYLEELLLSFNSLSGRVPGEVGLLARVKFVGLGANNLTGTIPSSLGNLSALTELDLGENNLEGTVPVELGCRSRLLPNPLNDSYSRILVRALVALPSWGSHQTTLTPPSQCRCWWVKMSLLQRSPATLLS